MNIMIAYRMAYTAIKFKTIVTYSASWELFTFQQS